MSIVQTLSFDIKICFHNLTEVTYNNTKVVVVLLILRYLLGWIERKMGAWLIVVLLVLNLSLLNVYNAKEILISDSSVSGCSGIEKSLNRGNDNNRYFEPFNLPGSIVTQLYAIYSFLPTSLVLNATLLVGSIYSGGGIKLLYQNDQFHPLPLFHIGQRKRIPTSFEKFFNFTYFQDYWLNKVPNNMKLSIFRQVQIRSCLKTSPSISCNNYTINTAFLKVPKQASLLSHKEEERPNQRKFLMKLLDHTETLTIIGRNSKSPSSHHYQATFFHFLNPPKLMGLYAFYNHSELLSMVVESLRPSNEIRRLLDPLIDQLLPSDFITTIVRLDIDYEIEHIKLLKSENMSKIELLQQLLHTSPCTRAFLEAKDKEKHPLPTLFLLTNTPIQSKIEKERYNSLLKIFKEFGFNIILNKKDILQLIYQYYMKLYLQKYEESINITTINEDLNSSSIIARIPSAEDIHHWIELHYFQLNYEQLSLLEIFIGLHSSCFIPSITANARSYFIQRLIPFYQSPKMSHRKEKNLFSHNKFHGKDSFDMIDEEKYGPSVVFRSWGI